MDQHLTYFLAPNFTFRPGSGPIRLGAIIADPFRPHRVLSTVDDAVLISRYPRVERLTERERTVARNSDNAISFGIWGRFLGIVGPQVAFEHGRQTLADYQTQALMTEYFVHDPSDEEIRARILEPRVAAVIKASNFGFRQPVYMVNGIKIAKQLIVNKAREYKVSAPFEIGGAVPTPAGQVDMGVSVSMDKTVGTHDGWTLDEDIVFAYQLLKIELKGWKSKELHVDEYLHKRAFLTVDDEDDGDETKNELAEVLLDKVTTSDLPDIEDSPAMCTMIKDGNGQQISLYSFPLMR